MLLGNCLNDIVIKDLFVLPFSVMILLTIHWTQGSFTCYTFPLLQDSCFYATSMTFLLIFYNRYKIASKVGLLGDLNEVCNQNIGLPVFWCLLVAWIISFIGVLPYTIYIEFIDLSLFLFTEPEGNGFCVVNLDGNIQEYIRCLFLSFYIIPIALVAYFHARTTTLMKSWPGYESTNFEILLPTLKRSNHRHLCVRGSGEESLVEMRSNESQKNETVQHDEKEANESEHYSKRHTTSDVDYVRCAHCLLVADKHFAYVKTCCN
ncbi:neuropeptide Y receptor type 5-like protein [Leptotrombidium deliense]|uniref:Neuropeptide Y receptor type 5-like protein n=1 Tax=Leptotrombidium deliense TaxID=299467 RepID=A0A443S7T6_9ACAR|nr:neuropeptide Y receptor type 5-like protein [Leptotrombidium deliense]